MWMHVSSHAHLHTSVSGLGAQDLSNPSTQKLSCPKNQSAIQYTHV